MKWINLDLDALRSLSLGMELGSFARAADRLARSPSAISAQLKKLEDQAGTPLLRKRGRQMELTEAGELLLSYARRMLEINDEACVALRGIEMEGSIRFGLQEDFGEQLLPQVLGRFARAHPSVFIEAKIARNVELVEAVLNGGLDLALAWSVGPPRVSIRKLATLPLRWIGPASQGASGPGREGPLASAHSPVPLVMLDAPCVMRTIATEALDRAGLPWRVAFTSPSLAGVWAGVAAGLGVSVRTELGLPGFVAPLARTARLPDLPRIDLAIHAPTEPATPIAERLKELVEAGVFEMTRRATHTAQGERRREKAQIA
ncbi:MAG: LysR substrate-binding domain-containing protein [Burkholderiaceae bacterium]|jgi:DNA-binding transcriptional LysR family regulator